MTVSYLEFSEAV